MVENPPIEEIVARLYRQLSAGPGQRSIPA
jgi:hypothetical protein